MPPPVPKMTREQYEKAISQPFLTRAAKFQIPAALVFVLERSIEIVNFYFIGHNGTIYDMGGCAVGNLLIVILILSIFLGLSSSVGSFISQAYHAQDYELARDYMNKGRAIAVMLSALCLVLFLVSQPLFLAMGMDPELVEKCY